MACLQIKYRTSANEYLEGGNRYNVPGPDYVVYIFVFFDGIIVYGLCKLTFQITPRSLCKMKAFQM